MKQIHTLMALTMLIIPSTQASSVPAQPGQLNASPTARPGQVMRFSSEQEQRWPAGYRGEWATLRIDANCQKGLQLPAGWRAEPVDLASYDPSSLKNSSGQGYRVPPPPPAQARAWLISTRVSGSGWQKATILGQPLPGCQAAKLTVKLLSLGSATGWNYDASSHTLTLRASQAGQTSIWSCWRRAQEVASCQSQQAELEPGENLIRLQPPRAGEKLSAGWFIPAPGQQQVNQGSFAGIYFTGGPGQP